MVIGSTIFCKQTDIKTIFQTFSKYPIDTFCASQHDYQMLDQQEQRKNNTHLQHLFSTEPIIDGIHQLIFIFKTVSQAIILVLLFVLS
jgi:hypothetical protein